QRDSDDRDEQRDGREHVPDGQPDAGDDAPDDIADEGEDPSVGVAHHAAPERPQGVGGDAEGGDAERHRDDQDAADDPGHGVSDGQPEPGEDQPDDVQNGAHASSMAP